MSSRSEWLVLIVGGRNLPSPDGLPLTFEVPPDFASSGDPGARSILITAEVAFPGCRFKPSADLPVSDRCVDPDDLIIGAKAKLERHGHACIRQGGQGASIINRGPAQSRMWPKCRRVPDRLCQVAMQRGGVQLRLTMGRSNGDRRKQLDLSGAAALLIGVTYADANEGRERDLSKPHEAGAEGGGALRGSKRKPATTRATPELTALGQAGP
jgi:hypothetical protein